MDLAPILDRLAALQAPLTWLAGGSASVAGGVWVVERTLLDRRARPAPNPAPRDSAVIGDSVTNSTIIIGPGGAQR